MVFVEPPAITEKVDIIDFSEKKQVVDSSSSFDTLQDERSIDGYDSSLEWTKEEESRVVRKIDFALFPFVLLMTFVLNMDRTNICK
jgi:hypothetical protein